MRVEYIYLHSEIIYFVSHSKHRNIKQEVLMLLEDYIRWFWYSVNSTSESNFPRLIAPDDCK